MHHTDYSSNLRKVQHKTLKKLSPKQANDREMGAQDVDLLRAAIAAILVILALLQMDPANAQSDIVASGYGHLVTDDNKRVENAQSFNHQMKMVISDQQVELFIDQSFRHEGQQTLNGLYLLPLPENARVNGWRIRVNGQDRCFNKQPNSCLSAQPQKAVQLDAGKTNESNLLRLVISAIAPLDTVRVQLTIQLPGPDINSPSEPLLPFTDDFKHEFAHSVSLVVESMNSLSPPHPASVLLPL